MWFFEPHDLVMQKIFPWEVLGNTALMHGMDLLWL
jgi:hypothetical protein